MVRGRVPSAPRARRVRRARIGCANGWTAGSIGRGIRAVRRAVRWVCGTVGSIRRASSWCSPRRGSRVRPSRSGRLGAFRRSGAGRPGGPGACGLRPRAASVGHGFTHRISVRGRFVLSGRIPLDVVVLSHRKLLSFPHPMPRKRGTYTPRAMRNRIRNPDNVFRWQCAGESRQGRKTREPIGNRLDGSGGRGRALQARVSERLAGVSGHGVGAKRPREGKLNGRV